MQNFEGGKLKSMNLTTGDQFLNFPRSVIAIKATINLLKFNFMNAFIHQISSDFSIVKVLHYTILSIAVV